MQTPNKKYLVISPEIGQIIPVMDDGAGPTEYIRCVAEVEASSKRKAISLAVKHPDMKEWVMRQRGDGLSPFIGLKGELA